MSAWMLIWICILYIITLQKDFVAGETSRVYDLIYSNIDVDSYEKCVRLLNGTNQVGCQSNAQGNVGVLYHANTSESLEHFFEIVSSKNYILLIESSFFNRSLVRRLKSFDGVQGVVVYAPEKFEPPEWSPDMQCPSERIGLYGPESQYANCKKPWNPQGDGLTEEDIPFPVFYTDNATSRDPLLKCYYEHNVPPETYPLCAAEMRAWMHAAVSSISCKRREQTQTTLTPVVFCDVMGGLNIVSSLKQFSSSYEGRKNSTILVTAPLDSRSFMSSYAAPGASEATSLVSLLGVAYALGQLTKAEKEDLSQNVVFVLLDGEAFDNIGSLRMVSDMKNNDFPVDRNNEKKHPPPINLQNVSAVIEMRQLGFARDRIFAHYDPVSYNDKTKVQIDNIIRALQSPQSFNISRQADKVGLAPSSLHSILREDNSIPGVVLSDYNEHFQNNRYFSRYDNLQNLNITWRENATEEEILSQFQDIGQRLSRICTQVAQAIYQLAGPNATSTPTVAVDSDIMAELLFCFLYKPNCSLFRQHLNFHADNFLSNTPYNRYISVYGNPKSLPMTNITFSVLASFTGDRSTNFTTCHSPDNDDQRMIYIYEKGFNNTPVCVVTSSFVTDAYPQHFLGADYAEFDNFPGMWAESRWANDAFQLRIFLVQDEVSQGLILMGGLLVFLSSFVIVWRLNQKAGIIFDADIQL